MQRRKFLLTTAALLSAAAAANGNGATVAPFKAALPAADLIVVDSRFVEGMAFASATRKSGATVHETHGDVTPLWLGCLNDLWREGSAPAVEGLTTPQALFCLEQLAADHRQRVTWRQHTPAGLVHWRIGPKLMS